MPSESNAFTHDDVDSVYGLRIKAPWTLEQVESLNDYQKSGVWHAYTGCNELAPDGEDDVLIATVNGWMSPHDPTYVQTWAWAWTADRTWEKMRIR